MSVIVLWDLNQGRLANELPVQDVLMDSKQECEKIINPHFNIGCHTLKMSHPLVFKRKCTFPPEGKRILFLRERFFM